MKRRQFLSGALAAGAAISLAPGRVLGANDDIRLVVDTAAEPLTLGPMLTMDPKTERFVGDFAAEANRLTSREYREPFVVRDEV